MQAEDTNLIGSSPLNGVRVIRLATVPYFLVSQLQQQAEQLAAAGMDVLLLVSADGPELARLNLGKNLRHKVIPFARAIRPWRDFTALLSLVRLIIRERPQILHSTTPKVGLLSAIAGFLTRVPVRLHTFTGQPWVNLRGPLRWIARAADRLIYQAGYPGLCRRPKPAPTSDQRRNRVGR
ncbi:MAG: glycosyltransferase [Chromatiales bacterium]|nr:glycosyltransferase [Chromatiales bacterium]